MPSIQKLLDEVEVLKVEMARFDGGTKGASATARKSLQSIKTITQDLRNEVQEIRKKMDTKTKAAKVTKKA
jgi:hypothetical protein